PVAPSPPPRSPTRRSPALLDMLPPPAPRLETDLVPPPHQRPPERDRRERVPGVAERGEHDPPPLHRTAQFSSASSRIIARRSSTDRKSTRLNSSHEWLSYA